MDGPKGIKQEEPVEYYLTTSLADEQVNVAFDPYSHGDHLEENHRFQVKQERLEYIQPIVYDDHDDSEPVEISESVNRELANGTCEYEPDSECEDDAVENDMDEDWDDGSKTKKSSKIVQKEKKEKRESLTAHRSIHKRKKFQCDVCKHVHKSKSLIYDYMKTTTMESSELGNKFDAIKKFIISTLGSGVSDEFFRGLEPSFGQSSISDNQNLVATNDNSVHNSAVEKTSTVTEMSEIDFQFDRECLENINDLDIILLRAKYLQTNALVSKDRNRLAKCIIKHLMSSNPNRQFDRQEFVHMANVIKEVFPTEETATYFIPSERGAVASGSLYSAYRFYREELGAVGLAKMRSKKKPLFEGATASSQTESAEDSLKLLESQTDPRALMELHRVQFREDGLEIVTESSEISEINFKFDRECLENINDLDVILLRAKYLQTNVLESKDRKRLAKCIIKHLMSSNPNRQFDRQEFVHIANVIKEVFPTEETATYFIPSERGAVASGLLYSSYRFYRDELGAVGLVKKRSKKKPILEGATANSQTESAEDSLKLMESQMDPRALMELLRVQSREDGLGIGSVIELGAEGVQAIKKTSTVTELSEIDFHFDRECFESITDLDIILLRAKYIQTNALVSKDRNRLAKCIIKHLMSSNPNRQFDRQEFAHIAKVIKEVFPTEETATYFIPSERGAVASGSLYSAYRFYRDELGAVGLAKMRSKKKRLFEEATASSQTESTEDSLKLLESQTDPRALIELHWVQSREARGELLAKMSNIAYISHFPVLQMGNGFEWLLMDFDAKYPSAPNILESWPQFAAKIMAYASSYRNKSEHLKALINSPEAATNSAVMAMKVLPLILKTTTKSTKNAKKPAKKKAGKEGAEEGKPPPKKTFRASKPEVAQDFLPHFPNDVGRTINELDDFPRMTLVGPNVGNCIMYVSIDNVEYGFSNPILGLDTCFKLYFILNCSYPASVSHIWQFIDIALYKLSDPKDVIPSVRTQLIDIFNFKEKK